MSKNILFLVTGMTPQIITETLWALACDPANESPWIPDEIHVASTDHGLNQIRERIFRQGNFAKMQQDFPQLKNVQFSPENLHGIVGKDGAEAAPLVDLKTPEDNELAADFICSMIRKFTQDEATNLHVSIAGGRKTMGFYAGYALSLYGRTQDRMSHVLVDERYESAKDFFYPSPSHDVYATDFNGKVIGRTKDAKIWLASISFVRLRGTLPKGSHIANASFSEVVNAIDLAQNVVKITLNELDKTASIGSRICKLKPQDFAFLYWFALVNIEGLPPIERPYDIAGDDYERAAEYQEIYEKLGKTFKREFDQVFFDERFSSMRKSMANEFGQDLVDKILPKIKRDSQEDRFYRLNIAAENIEIKEM